ncbi:protein DpdJ [Kineococcus radiotolerans]|uniref:DEAD/DEAH box helicase domain protein n=1 Tax=Kineococcus radiotolerans (strain ATCC BAA-149 / DSM 14245 / SRS30216) TaxID=266940 RepID=A6WGB0_KINRD|nr:protein DpdJ [Kineococcus radiotolerans]ABS05849.1 DEAD/DEAH box helicase domain protein [Kineococcus radiotolerans SRS30216 = ATCC BAA-149]
MSESLSAATLGALLSSVEDVELPLLTWGYVEGALDTSEVLRALEVGLSEAGDGDMDDIDADEVLQLLEERGLLVQVSPDRWRSRLAETLRLTAHLRQLLGEGNGQWWLRGRSLVSDFRLNVQPRRYPRRDLPGSNAQQALEAVQPLTDAAQVAVSAFVRPEQRLARFQLDASTAIRSALLSSRTEAVIVAAGTGSGKTLAFYLPAFAWMSERLTAGEGVQTLAIYPRTELLKDQVGEALASALVISEQLAQHGHRPLRIATLYGDTPWAASSLESASWHQEAWPHVGDGRRCPYAVCPHCQSDLVWLDSDRSATPPRERLVCRGCARTIPGDVLALTRQSMIAQAPDVLFTTTEMLNRASSHPSLGRLLGFRPGTARPRLLLLDEVHTYEGVHGAQVALLLRRWRHAIGQAVTVVGLSATLRDADTFMARLVGISEADVTLIEPAEVDLVDEGRQYQLVIRGDATSGASLLSTTIQTSMLLGRVLDPPHTANTIHGSKGFLFTDDLDVTNRLFHDLRDAEGEGWMSKRRSGAQKVLANLRSPRLPACSSRDVDGQVWTLPERIGHALPGMFPARGLKISKTSSQDPGVAAGADLVVATASLDVGFNDPRVGLVLQHKSPRDAAQFLQRRGRAGRTRDVRPLTAVVLSDFGRDRLTYQAYDQLFDPELLPRALPVGNRYVLRMQATLALKDWLTRQVQWREDAGRVLTKNDRREEQDLRDRVAELLNSVLTDTVTQDALAEYLRRALRIDADEVQNLLWDPPRALMTAVVPTLLRRLRTLWRPVGEDPGGEAKTFAVEFVPPALFAELNLPEVQLLLPDSYRGTVETRMPILQALREAAPGRISKRFAVRSSAQTTWVPIPTDASDVQLPLGDFVKSGSVEGTWRDDTSGDQRRVVRPYLIQLEQPPRTLAESSNSRPLWCSQIVAGDGEITTTPVPQPWSAHIRALSIHTHANRRPLEVRRFTPGTRARLRSSGARTADPAPNSTSITYIDRHGDPAALGFALDVDGLRVSVRLPSPQALLASPHLRTPAWRSARVRHLIAADTSLDSLADEFTRPWLALTLEVALLTRAVDEDISIATALDRVSEADLLAAAGQVAGAEAPTTDAKADGAHDEPNSDASEIRDLHGRLRAALTSTTVRDALLQHAQALHADPGPADARFAQQVFARTLGAALQRTCLLIVSNAQDNDLVLDVVDDEEESTIWLTEATVGGAGIIEAITAEYARNPRRFWRLTLNALEAGEYETLDHELSRLVADLSGDPDGALALAVRAVRTATSAHDTRAHLDRLHQALTIAGYATTHPVLAAIAIRLLRPGTTPRFDDALHRLAQGWSRVSQQLGMDIDARAWSLIAGRALPDITDVFSTPDHIYASLWPRGSEVFHRDLAIYAPYVDRVLPLNRHLTAALFSETVAEVSVTEADWRQRVQDAVVEQGLVDLTAPVDKVAVLKAALLHLSVDPLDSGYMLLHPVLHALRRSGGHFTARLELREAEQ